MFNISNNKIISLERGDSGKFKVIINLNSKINPILYELKDNDKVYFGVMEARHKFENSIIRKIYTKDDEKDFEIEIELKPQDTLNLLSGNYYYEIKVEIDKTTTDIYGVEEKASEVYTIQPRTKFVIVE